MEKNINSTLQSNFWSWFFTGLILFITANASVITSDNFILFVTILTMTIFIVKNNKLDKILILTILLFSFINFISYFFVNITSFEMRTFTGFILKIAYPYFILKIVGKEFFTKLEKIIYFLTIISLPIFILQLFFPGFFHSLSSALNFITLPEQKQAGGWYVIFYMFSGWFPERNAGFMWEPGAFAFIILLGITINISKYKEIRFSKRMIFYYMALITTLSTMGYIALSIILLSYFIKKKKLWILILLLPLLLPYIYELLQLSFLLPKINEYIDSINRVSYLKNVYYLKGNRFTYFLLAVKQSLHWPFGFGIVPSKYILAEFYSTVNGVGSLSKILLVWGWEGIILFIYAIFQFYKLLINKKGKLLVFTLSIVLLVGFFSNPLEKSPILFTIFYFPFIFKKSYVF